MTRAKDLCARGRTLLYDAKRAAVGSSADAYEKLDAHIAGCPDCQPSGVGAH